MAADAKTAPVIPNAVKFLWAARTNPGEFALLEKSVLERKPICNNPGLADYITKSALPTSDWIVVAVDSSKPVAERVRGFAILAKRPVEQKVEKKASTKKKAVGPIFRTAPELHMFLDVICATPGYGTPILRFVDQLTRTLGFKLIELHALPNVINYYRKQGYLNSKPGECQENSTITMAADTVAQAKFATVNEALDDEKYNAFLQTLVDDGTAAREYPACKGTGRTKAGCGYDGFLMTRCLPSEGSDEKTSAAAAPKISTGSSKVSSAVSAAAAPSRMMTRAASRKPAGKVSSLTPAPYFS
jgi:hypothetical protein